MSANVVAVAINACTAEHMVKIGLNSMCCPRFPLSAPSAGMGSHSFADIKNGLAL